MTVEFQLSNLKTPWRLEVRLLDVYESDFRTSKQHELETQLSALELLWHLTVRITSL